MGAMAHGGLGRAAIGPEIGAANRTLTGVNGANGDLGRAAIGPVFGTPNRTANRTDDRAANDVKKNVLLILMTQGSVANGGVPEDECHITYAA